MDVDQVNQEAPPEDAPLESYGFHSLSLNEVKEIIEIPNLTLRNLRITQSYHDISLGFEQLIGKENVNWCSFATWASKTAGYSIRKEEPAKCFHQILHASEQALKAIEAFDRKLLKFNFNFSFLTKILSFLERAMDEVSQQISAGNLKVYEELAPVFIRLIDTFSDDKSFSEDKLRDFNKSLKPGKTEEGGQDLLKVVCRHYVMAQHEKDPHRKAELIYFANNCTGLHEQMRLQDYIIGGLEAPVRVGFKSDFSKYFLRILPESFQKTLNSFLDEHIESIESRVLKCWRIAVTKTMMELKMPERTLDLSKDVPALSKTQIFPDDLYEIDEPELLAQLKQWDLTPNSIKNDAAVDWSILTERMDYILDLFRTRQQYMALYHEPFTLIQHEAIMAGEIPEGEL